MTKDVNVKSGVTWAVLMGLCLFVGVVSIATQILAPYSVQDIRDACREHSGVQQVEGHMWEFGTTYNAVAVCKDGEIKSID